MATELADGVWWFDLGRVNAYLYEAGEPVLVDAGTPGSAAALRDGIEAAGHRPEDVGHVLVTHYDVDHVGGLERLDDAMDATVYARAPGVEHLRGAANPSVTTLKGISQRFMGLSVAAPELPVESIDDGDEVAGLTAYATPGHTAGHTAFVDAQVAFLGDLVVGDHGRLDVPPWYLNRHTAAVRESVRSLAERTPPFEVAAPGHGDPLPADGHEALSALGAGTA
ncbi:MAG: MBL fold metallo-hydrolase [Halobacteriales archaeon]